MQAHYARVNVVDRDGCDCMLHAVVHAHAHVHLCNQPPPRPWQIRFDVPVCITQVRIADASKSGASGAAGPAPLLRLFARDIYALSCSRFAPLCSSTISCTGAQPSTYKTEVSSAALCMTWTPSRVSQRLKDVLSKGCLDVMNHSRFRGRAGIELSRLEATHQLRMQQGAPAHTPCTHTPRLLSHTLCSHYAPPSIQAIVTNHVVVRGRYTAVELSLIGVSDHHPPPSHPQQQQAGQGQAGIKLEAAIKAEPADPASVRSGGTVPPEATPSVLRPELQLPLGPASLLLPAAASAPPGSSSPLVGPLPLPDLAPFMIHALSEGLEYFRVVQRSHKRICTNPPWHKLAPLHEVAHVMCSALQGAYMLGMGGRLWETH